jgi:hypothetical protein
MAFEAPARERAWRAAAGELWWDIAGPLAHADALPSLADTLFGAAPEPSALLTHARSGELAAAVAADAWSDWWQRIGHALGVDTADTATRAGSLGVPPGDQAFRPWSGAVSIALHWCGREMHLLLAGDAAARLLAPARPPDTRADAQPLVPVWHAVADLNSVVRAELSPVELTVGALKSLRPGDVVEIPHPLDRPLVATTSGGETLCEVFLGQAGGRRAIELLAPSMGA